MSISGITAAGYPRKSLLQVNASVSSPLRGTAGCDASRRQSVRDTLFLSAILPMKLADHVKHSAALVGTDGASSADPLAHCPHPAGATR